MTLASGLYDGVVLHKRVAPRRHSLRYRLFWMLIDLDELPRLQARLRLFSHNGFNLFSLVDRDHLAGTGMPLRTQVEAHLRDGGIADADGPIRLLCIPRLLGHAFNPLSLYLCHRADGSLAAILYEVNNTFGQRHCYLAPAGLAVPVRQRAGKAFYVSPFMAMDLVYTFRVTPPAASVAVSVLARDGAGPVIATSFSGQRRPLSDAMLLRVFASHPLMTLKVVLGIHWEALRLWGKGLRFRPRPSPPALDVTRGELLADGPAPRP